MDTYYHSPNTEKEASPMVYTQESWPRSNPEPSPIIPTSMMVYMNYVSSTNSFTNTNDIPPPDQEILSDLPGPCIENENKFSVWGNNIRSATSLLEGVQSLHGHGQGQGLSLSLSTTQIPSTVQIPTIEFSSSNMGGFSSLLSPNNNPSNRLNDDETLPNKHARSEVYSTQPGFLDENLSNYVMPGVGKMVPNSKYLNAAQQLLDEVVNIRKALKKQDSKNELAKGGDGMEGESRSENKFPAAGEASLDPKELKSDSPNELSAAEKQDLQNKLSKFLAMLDEVDRRYKQYYHQMQIVVLSFDVIAGCGAAKQYTVLALQAISRHFRCLHDAITNQIRAVRKSLGEQDSLENGKGVVISRLRYIDQHLKQQRAFQQLGMLQQHTWRPQRGLPESSVSILRAWMFEHFLHPYPKDSEKLMLARQTGLTRSQVSNWFINARVRLWKPMVEEMYKEEAGNAEMGFISSPETGNRATEEEVKASDNIDNQDLQEIMNSTEQSKKGQFLESKHGLVSNMEIIATTNPTLQSETDEMVERRPCLDDGGLFQGYQIPGFRRFGNTDALVSLTLGLQHCEGGNLPICADNQNYAIYNTESSLVDPQTADFDVDTENRQHRYGSSHLLRDFVA